MRHLSVLNKFFWKYRWRLTLGIIFIVFSNYFAVLAPQVTGFVVNDFVMMEVQQRLGNQPKHTGAVTPNDPLVDKFIAAVKGWSLSFSGKVALCGIALLALALLRGFFMFLMRQTIIVMSRHIEYDQKNQIYKHYQELDTGFYRTHDTGDLMNRVSEDVSRVRMYVGPAFMYSINLVALISLTVFYMFRKNSELSWVVLAPLPVLALAIYFVNTIIHRKSEKIQQRLSDLTTNAQQSYSGIRVIKSYVQEKAMLGFFEKNSEEYKQNALSLAKTEAIFMPAMGLIIGISIIITIWVGGVKYINGNIDFGDIAAFVMYINMLMWPVGAIGWVASMVQRAAASQKRINEFLQTRPEITNPPEPAVKEIKGEVEFRDVTFTYDHSGITALKHLNLHIRKGEKIAIIGRTGSGKSSIAQLLLRMYDPTEGEIYMDGTNIKEFDLTTLRKQVGYVPQDVFLFSDSIKNNILFGTEAVKSIEAVEDAARKASVYDDIAGLSKGIETVIGERGVTLSGGQKQRVTIARALIKNPGLLILDDSLSSVDARTEKEIIQNLYEFLRDKTAIIITHRIFSLFDFDKVVVLDNGKVVETGTHEQLLSLNGYYSDLYARQQLEEEIAG